MQIGGLGTKGTATLGGTSQIQKSAKKTAENAITDGFVKQIQTLAREDAEKGIYMDTEFRQIDAACSYGAVCVTGSRWPNVSGQLHNAGSC